MAGAQRVQLTAVLAIVCVSWTSPVLGSQHTSEDLQERQAKSGWQGAIVAHLDNYAAIPPANLAEAEQEAARIYNAIGVRMIWVHGGVQPGDPPGLLVRVLLLSRDMATQKIKRDGVADGVLGQAARLSGCAYVFTHRVIELAFRNNHAIGWVLGVAIAHEVGHLALPNDGHSDRGIMRANLFFRSRTDQGFTTDQGAAIRSRVMAHSKVPPGVMLVTPQCRRD